MRVRALGSSGGSSPGHLMTSFRINEDVVLDAGSTTDALTLEEQTRIDHVLVTHAHLDHTGTLPYLVDNIYGLRETPFAVHGAADTLEHLREHLFNNQIWPDFTVIPDFERAAIRFSPLELERPVQIGSVRVTAVTVSHTVVALGYIVEDDRGAIVFSGDTAPTERLWELASAHPRLRAAFVETSFPNSMQRLADISGHLTPNTLKAELPKLRRDVPVYIYHIKPRFWDEVVDELKSVNHRELRVVEAGRTYEL